MRLGAYIGLELAAGVALATGLAVGGSLGLRELADSLDRPAHAAEVSASDPAAPPLRIGSPEALATPGRIQSEIALFDGIGDEYLLEPLRGAEIVRVKKNTGGSSLSFRIDFANGARAAFKPRQINWQSVPRREVAAYRINRLLGLSTVAPAIGARFPVAELYAKLDPDSRFVIPRIQAEMIVDGEYVTGELQWWIPVITHAEVSGFRIDSVEGIVTWKRHLTAGEPIPHRDWRMTSQISDMVLFDFLINNPDRWSGGNARANGDGSVLYFMDNTMSFGSSTLGHPKTRVYFERAQKFSRKLVERLRELDEDEVRAALAGDVEPWDALLEDDEIAAMMVRRDHALAYIDALIAVHGEDEVLVFP